MNDLYNDVYIEMLDNNLFVCDFYQNGSHMGPSRSGMVPEASQALPGHFAREQQH